MLGRAIYQHDSFLHRLHPLTKVGAAASVTGLSLALDSPRALGMLLLLVLALLILGKVRLPGKALLLLCPIGIVGLGGYAASGEPATGACYAIRLAVLFGTVPVCALTTSPQQIARALSCFRLPGGLLIAVLLVWRFFPVLGREMREIHKANMLRGRTNSGPFYRWYRGLLVPLVFASVEHADRITLALELRGFDPVAGRSWYRKPRFGVRDALFVVAVLAVLLSATFYQWGGKLL